MREIKFRGKRIDNGEWVYGYYYEYNFKSIICSEEHSDDADTYYNNEVILETVGQFTGLKDKNGVEIYEGGRFRDKDGNVYIVLFEDFQFIAKCEKAKIEHYFSQFSWNSQNNIEVIGNIHDK